MSGDGRRPQDDDELTLVWDDWEDALEVEVDEPTQTLDHHAGPPPAPTAPPPSQGGRKTPLAPAPGPQDEIDPDLDIFDLGDDEDEATRIAEVPLDLMHTLQGLDGAPGGASTKPPPPNLVDEISGALELPEDLLEEGAEPLDPPGASLQIADDEEEDDDDDPVEYDDESTSLFSAAHRPPPPKPAMGEATDSDPPDLPDRRTIPRSQVAPGDLPDLPDRRTIPRESFRGPLSEAPAPLPLSDEPELEIESAIADVLEDESRWTVPPLDDGLADDLADLSPPSSGPPEPKETVVPPPGPMPVEARRPSEVDRVAQAARRTVRSRKPRVEHMPLVGEGGQVDSARRELLYDLAQASTGAERAALFVQAGTIAEAQDDLLAAREAYDEARAADATSAEPLRALQRVCGLEGDWPNVYELLMAESGLDLSEATRAEAASAAAMVALRHLEDPQRAIDAANAALALDPSSTYAAAIVARAHVQSHDEPAQRALLALAARTEDARLSATLNVLAALAVEREEGECEKALGLHQRALEVFEGALDAQLGVARNARALGHHELSNSTLSMLAEGAEGEARKRALGRARARVIAEDLERPLEALPILEQTNDPVTLRERVRVARLAGDVEPALRARAEHSSGTERALAFVELAQWHHARGDHAEAETCLKQAREADGTLTLTLVVREILARQAGNASELAEATAEEAEDAQAALTAAARLATDPEGADTECAWLDRAVERGAVSALTRVLSIDAAAQAGHTERVARQLQQLTEHPEPGMPLAACLAQADLAARAGDAEGARAALQLALDAAPGEPLTLRAMMRAAEQSDERAQWLEREAGVAGGHHAASLHLARAHLLMGTERQAALEASLDAARDYVPARLTAIAAARARGDLETLQALCGEAAEGSEGASAVEWLVRAALIGAERDSDAAAELLVHAAGLAPHDAILRVLVSRVGDALPAELRAEMFEHSVDDLDDALLRGRLLNAAGAFEDAKRPEHALALYQRALSRTPTDAVARLAVQRLQLAAGQSGEVLAQLSEVAESAEDALPRLRALRSCARIALAAGDREKAEHFAREVLKLEPGDPEGAHLLERLTLAQADRSALLELERRMLETSTGPLDRGARLRLLSALLKDQDPGTDESLDEVMCRLADKCAGGPWLARRLITAGQHRGESHAITAGWTLLLNHAVTARERATVLLRLGERHPANDATITDMLRGALQAAPEHSAVAERLALRLQSEKRYSEAAELFEQAARAADSVERQVRLLHLAGVLWQDRVERSERARESLRAAARLDVGYSDVSERLERLLGGAEDIGGLIALTETRLAATSTPAEQAQLRRSLADLHEKNGDRDAAREQLEATLELEPEDVDSLRKLAKLHERDGEYKLCAEAWIQAARKLREPGDLVEVFYKLGCLYDEQLPDETRAAAAYRRVLKLDPRHAPSLRALAALCERKGKTDAEIECLARLAQAESDPEARRDVVLRLAKRLEAAGRGPDAEQVLENLRKSRPTDLQVLSALAVLYRKQAAGSALAMHTNRAAGDLRHALAEHIDSPALWRSLIDVLSWRGRAELPRLVATTAISLGVDDPQVAAQAAAPGALGGAGSGVLQPGVADLLAPEGLSRSLRHVLAESSEVLEKVMPFDPRAAAAEKISRKHPLRLQSRDIARWFDLREATIWVSPRVPTAFLTVSDTSPAFVVGSAIIDTLDEAEQRFLLARAYAFASTRMSVVCRVSPDDLAVLLHSLVRAFVETHEPKGIDEATLAQTAARIHKVLPRKLREQLHDEVVEVGGAHDFDPTGLYAQCSRMASRLALVATGSIRGSLSSLCKLAGSLEGTDSTAHAIRRTREARQLASFAISETHFEARRRAGADGG